VKELEDMSRKITDPTDKINKGNRNNLEADPQKMKIIKRIEYINHKNDMNKVHVFFYSYQLSESIIYQSRIVNLIYVIFLYKINLSNRT
jgi:hypothetical protein